MRHPLSALFLPSLLLIPLATLLGCDSAVAQQVIDTDLYKVRATKVIAGLKNPWSIAFLPDGRWLVTERAGRMRVVDNGKLLAQPIAGLPPVIEHGQGGLLDVVLHPKYAQNGWIYWTYNAGTPDSCGTELARGKLGGTADAPTMTNVEVLFKLEPKSGAGQHFGSRIVFDKQGFLYVTLGDRGDSPGKGANQRAQQLNDLAGKTVRLTDDGKVPADNPFVKTAGARPEIFTYGNRNVQGAAMHPVTQKLWAHEHGPQGGDELNILTAGTNYGWPVITYGANYGSGTKIGEGTAKEGMAQPIVYWLPSIAPSGMMFYSGKKFPQWKDNLFVGALAYELVVRITLDGDKVVSQERMFGGKFDIKAKYGVGGKFGFKSKFGRIRDVREGPDGFIYLLTDSSDGEIIRLEPDQ